MGGGGFGGEDGDVVDTEEQGHEVEDIAEGGRPWCCPPPKTLNDFCTSKHLSRNATGASHRRARENLLQRT